MIAAAEEENVSVSAWMTEAARRSLMIRDGLDAVREWEAEHGAFSEAERAAAPPTHRRRSGLELRLVLVRVVYDAGVLVAADRNDRLVWADHHACLELGLVPETTAPVVAQASRSLRQAQLRRRFLHGCSITEFSATSAHEVGMLLARTGMSDVVDAHVVLTASRQSSVVLTSDPDDLTHLASVLAEPVAVRSI